MNTQIKIFLTIGTHKLSATLQNNTSAHALIEKLKHAPIQIEMQDYANMEKVGMLPFMLPRNDKQLTTKPGDLILYQGNSFVLYYAPNSWNFTHLGTLDNINETTLKQLLGKNSVSVTLSLQ